MTRHTFLRTAACFALLLMVLFSGCSKTETASEHIDRIIEACTKQGNIFPTDKLKVEFLKYELPSTEQNSFHYTVRFENISEESVETQILGFYDIALNDSSMTHTGSLQAGEPGSPLTLEPKEGWIFDIPVSPSEFWDSYSADEQEQMTALAKYLYFEIALDGEAYYCILDFENKIIITTQ